MELTSSLAAASLALEREGEARPQAPAPESGEESSPPKDEEREKEEDQDCSAFFELAPKLLAHHGSSHGSSWSGLFLGAAGGNQSNHRAGKLAWHERLAVADALPHALACLSKACKPSPWEAHDPRGSVDARSKSSGGKKSRVSAEEARGVLVPAVGLLLGDLHHKVRRRRAPQQGERDE